MSDITFTPSEVVQYLSDKKIKLSLAKNHKIRLDAPSGAVNPLVVDLVTKYKAGIIQQLKSTT